MQQLIIEIGNAIWWAIEPHWNEMKLKVLKRAWMVGRVSICVSVLDKT
jgi:hypothetical protein